MIIIWTEGPAESLNLMLVNHSAQTSEPVNINYAGFNPGSVTSAQQLSEANRKLAPINGLDPHSLTLPPYSITTLQLSPVGSKPGSAASPTSATSSAPAAGTGSHTTATGSHTSPAGSHTSVAAGYHPSEAAAQGGTGSTTTTASGQSGTAPGSTTSTAAAHADKAAASIGPLAFTGAGSVVTYGLFSVIAIAAGSVLVLRRRSVKSAHSTHRQ